MIKERFSEIIEDCPVITAIKDERGLEKCFEAESRIIFILYGDICNIAEIVDRIKEAGKIAIVHTDLVSGFSNKEITVDFLAKYTRADGVVSTKAVHIKRAKELGMYTVHRFFAIDSKAYDAIKTQSAISRPDCIEILPGCMNKVTAKIAKTVKCPVIAGGLISEKHEVIDALNAGAVAISTTDENIWFI